MKPILFTLILSSLMASPATFAAPSTPVMGDKEGNGANTLPGPSAGVGEDQLEASLLNAKTIVAAWLKYENVRYKFFHALFQPGAPFPTDRQQPSVIDHAIHGGPKEIISRLGQLLGPKKIEIRKTAPCEEAGVPRDGSYTEGSTQPICISFFTLSKKLDEDSIDYQLVGLIAHELAHAAGLDETHATQFQKIAKHFYLKSTTEETVDDLVAATMNGIQNANWGFHFPSIRNVCRYNLEHQLQFFGLWGLPLPRGNSILAGHVPLYSDRFPTSVFDGKQIALFIEANMRALNAMYYSCAFSPSVPASLRAEMVVKYNDIYGNSDQISGNNFFRKNENVLGQIWPQKTAFYYPRKEYSLVAILGRSYSLKKISTEAELESEVNWVRQTIQDLETVVRDFKRGRY